MAEALRRDLRYYVKNSGCSIAELAAIADVPRCHIHKILANGNPTLYTLAKLADALGVTLQLK